MKQIHYTQWSKYAIPTFCRQNILHPGFRVAINCEINQVNRFLGNKCCHHIKQSNFKVYAKFQNVIICFLELRKYGRIWYKIFHQALWLTYLKKY